MILALITMAALWFGGEVLAVPRRPRLIAVLLIWALWLAVLVLRVQAGSARALDAMAWALGPPLWLAVLYYLRWIGRLRSRAQARTMSRPGMDAARPADLPPQAPEVREDVLSGSELERYSRHILLREIGGAGQRQLKQARVLVVGAGGLGAPVLQYLAAAGVGTLGIVDDDAVQASNLHRQVIHDAADIGRPKVFSAADRIAAQNPHTRILPYRRRLDSASAEPLFADFDLILDGSDNFQTRYLVNAAAVATGRPLLSGAMSQWEGQVLLLDPVRGGPCYRCIFPEAPAEGLVPACSVAGVIGSLPGVIGTLMATEAIKLLTGAGRDLRGRMLIWDALEAEMREIRLKRDPACPLCGTLHGQG